ncbi:class A beta-lactamase, subclass A2 [Alistipes timonensis]|uniref:class A beta-lactamase, subclass A2 n=1 Tax=Alistipes timonensis TaxID=1465754 RepID=UPI00266F5236|nr:class A beta-lactamase, subclass A2 [Alistipes timonensis]
MKRLFLLCCCLAAAAPLSARDESLGRAVRAVADSVRATVGVAVVFEEGDTLVVNNACRYPTMSVYKFHQALAVLDRLGRSGLPLTTRIPVLRSDLLPDTWSPLREACPGGGRFTVAELLAYSVAQSDNNVCDLLFRFLGGPEVVNRYIAGLGVGETEIAADEETMHRRTDNQYLNWTTPLAAVRLLELFRRGKLLSAESGDFLLKTMFATETGPDKLRGLLPPGVAVAHKTGSAFRDAQGVMVADNDIGIVRLPDGRSYSIAVFVMDSREDDRTNAAVIARISRLVYDYATRR